MSFKEPNDPRSREIINNQIQLTELVMYEERTPGQVFRQNILKYILNLDTLTKHFQQYTVKTINTAIKTDFNLAKKKSTILF